MKEKMDDFPIIAILFFHPYGPVILRN